MKNMGLGLLLSIIKLGTGLVDVRQISQDSKVSVSLVEKTLKKLEAEKMIRFEDGCVTASPEQRLELAMLAIKGGADIERVCKLLGWREFEDLAVLVLGCNGFSTRKHFRFKTQGRWFEIDVLGIEEPLVLSIDCKRWRRSWQRSATMRIVEKQLRRTLALVNSFQSLGNRLEVNGWKGVRVLPLILTMSETPLKTYDKVPVIPIFYFQNFLNNEMNTYINEFMVYEVKGAN